MNQLEDELQNLSINNETKNNINSDNPIKQYYTTKVLKELLSTKLITLKNCNRCKRYFDGDNFKYNEKKKEYLKQCSFCKRNQQKYSATHYEKNKDSEEYQKLSSQFGKSSL